MSDNERKGFFSRLFGRKQDRSAATPASQEAPAAPEPAGAERPVPQPEPAEAAAPPAADSAPHAPQDAVAPEPEAAAAPDPEAAPQAPGPVAGTQPVAAPGAPRAPEPAPEPEPPAPKPSWWQRLKGGLARTSSSISNSLADLFVRRKLDAAALEDLEDILIQADLGVDTTERIVRAVSAGRFDREVSADEIRAVLAREVEATLAPVAKPLEIDAARKPFIILMVGVNGAGKTTTIGKLAQKFRAEGRSVMLAAGDTFRAAAIEQLKVWGERTGATVISRPQGADAAGLAFDAVKEAKERGVDVLMIDTAGRLQNKAGLMAELEKIVRVVKKLDPEAPHAALLVLDATTGQNAVSQVEIFGKTAGVTGLIMTKLDGTARGGILVSIAARTGLPVHFIGVGEGVDDLEPFAARDFARAIAGLPEKD
ncbi:signal recognition particle-docking protein FtsY [Camelimonas abortus]|uniref:Signal recognition particle receptor FtsY n=1 Tax=Camelimonas abortus TaxID=1017184 RepID=A0ABV7LDC3_9HYPH